MRRFLLSLLLVSLFGIFSVGCLQAKRREAVRYDAAMDTFHVLRLYTDITAQGPEDVKHLAALYTNRDHILLFDPIAIFKEAAAVRLDKEQALPISLGEHQARPDVFKTDLDLSQVNITPGQFFLSPAKTLCYYQQMSAPGKFIDQLLAKGSEALRTELLKEITQERDRRKNGGQRLPWEMARQEIVNGVDPAPAAPNVPDTGPVKSTATEPARPGPSMVVFYSDVSLAALDKCISDKTLTLARQGSTINLNFTVTSEDARAMCDNFTQLRTALHVRADATPQAVESARRKRAAIVQIFDALTITSPQNGSICASVEAVDIVDRLMAVVDAEEAAKTDSPAATPAPQAVPTTRPLERIIDGLRERGVPINEKLALPDIIPAFKKGSLPANPSANPVVPGTGMFEDVPTTSPGK